MGNAECFCGELVVHLAITGDGDTDDDLVAPVRVELALGAEERETLQAAGCWGGNGGDASEPAAEQQKAE